MKRSFSAPLMIICTVLLFSPVLARSDWIFDVEGGYAWPGYIDVRIPNDTGTSISLKDDIPAGSRAVYRLRLGYQFHPKHSVSFLFAPFGLNAQGTAEEDISFNGDFFPAGTDLEAFYKFNSSAPGRWLGADEAGDQRCTLVGVAELH